MKSTALNSLRFVLVLFCVLSTSVLYAQVVEFDAEISSAWNEEENWNPDGVPMFNNTAIISNGHTATITGGSVPSVGALEIGIGASPGSLSINGAGNIAMLEVLNDVSIGPRGDLAIGVSSAHLVVVGPELQNQGDVTVSTGGQITALQEYTQNNGSTILLGGDINTTTMRINRGELTGFGQINGNVTIGNPLQVSQPATLSPGIGIGDLTVNGDLELTRNAQFVVEIDASRPTVLADELSVTGTVLLGGTLHLELLGDLITTGEKVQILVADAVQPGTYFDDITGQVTDDGWLIVTFVPGGPMLSPSVTVDPSSDSGDMNGDGIVDELDAHLFAWAVFDAQSYNFRFAESPNRYPCHKADIDGKFLCGAAPDIAADMDGMFGLNFIDLQLFLEKVDEDGGNPVAALAEIMNVFQGTTVPEPSALGLALGTMGGLAGLSRRRGLSALQEAEQLL